MKISVFVTSYNQREYLREALDSVLAQTLPPYEIVVIDDGSADGSRELITNYQSRFPALMRPVFNERNAGIPVTKSRAVAAATGDWITYCDGDDRWLPEKLEREVATAQAHPDCGIVFSNFRYIDPDGASLFDWALAGDHVPEGNVLSDVFARRFPRRTLFRSELTRAGLFRDYGAFAPELAMYHDWDLRIRLTAATRIAYNPELLSEYRVNPSGVSRSAAARHVAEATCIFRKNAALLGRLPPAVRRQARRDVYRWVSEWARQAAEDTLNDGSFGWCRRRLRAVPFLWLCARHEPRLLDLKLMLRTVLPDRIVSRMTRDCG